MTLGFPDSLHDEMFGDSPKVTIGASDPLRMDTEFAVEMGLVAEYANGSMREWNSRSWAERRAWVYFKVLHNAKVKRADEIAVAEAKSSSRQDMPTVVKDRQGIRNR